METNDIGDQHLPLQQNLQQDDDISEIKLSDVIEVLRDDMFQNTGSIINTVAGNGGAVDHSQQQNNGFNGQLPPQQQQPAQTHQQQPANSSRSIRRNASVKITEQPASKALRFRYECEGRSAGSIPGVNSTPENKTFPTIEIVGYKGRAVVVVSCVTKDHDQQQKYKPHPHNLVGKEGCKKGVCTLEINSETMRAVFSNLGIQCVKKKDIEAALKAREDIRVDPYKTGFSHRLQPSSIDLNSVRLCFQVFLESEQKGRFTVPLDPVVSDPIYDKKAMSDLVICTLCSCTSTVAGGKEIILLCEKVAKEDISIRFYEENNGHVIWEGFGDFQHTDVHKQTAIKFKTPRYKTLELDQPAKVYIQLRRPSDGATSESLPFDYLPLDSDPAVLKRKRQKTGGDASLHLIRRHFQNQEIQQQHQNEPQDGRLQQPMGFMNLPASQLIKTEPRDTSPLPYNPYVNAYRLPELSPSPQPLSPTNYNNQSNTPSPYGAGNISPNINYEMFGPPAPAAQQQYAMNPFNNQQQQQQQWGANLKPPQQQQQQQQHMPNANNLNSTSFNVNNLLTNVSQTTGVVGGGSNEQWHLSGVDSKLSVNNNFNNFNNISQINTQQQHQHHQQQQQIHHQQQHVTDNANSINICGDNTDAQEAPTLSNLDIDIDSDILKNINPADYNLSGLSLS